ncbi:hypothetical protein F5Y19DRAFT_473362 [Xylariaceae sp. FL1651]|nr:hypothetical protein F5Y19DRAFT_473362 [Xylariaceae sp. FL1651]
MDGVEVMIKKKRKKNNKKKTIEPCEEKLSMAFWSGVKASLPTAPRPPPSPPIPHSPFPIPQLPKLPPSQQRHQTLPPAQTSSARAALQSFYCDLCSKGYSRMNDYEAHLGSYDHSHRQRMKDMKQMVKDPTAGARARRAEAKADGLISIKLGGSGEASSNDTKSAGGAGAATGFKKGGFKKSGFKSAFAPVGGAAAEEGEAKTEKVPTIIGREDTSALRDLDVESDTDDEGYEVYNPRFPTD